MAAAAVSDLSSKKFGTTPVFFTAISTILGAILFLRFGYAVGNVGFIGTLMIVLIGHAVTIPTAMALAEIATNQKVEGGGEYFIISRSFGMVIGSSIGIALYLSQAVSVAFYIMAFAEAFNTLIQYLTTNYDLPDSVLWLLSKKQSIGIPALIILTAVMLTQGAKLGVKLLYIVVVTLILALIALFFGATAYDAGHSFDVATTVADAGNTYLNIDMVETVVPDPLISPDGQLLPLSFFALFAIIFPAFTGMTAGVGLSGDLKDPGKSIPLGTLAGTIIGMVVYILISWKLASSAHPVDLVNTDRMIIGDIAWQGWWIMPVGLAAATISSALGSIMVAPRTLQAIARDNVLPNKRISNWLSKGLPQSDEPFNASIITIIIGFAFILIGGLDFVAGIISMFFMLTYGSLCLISFLQHFSADPSYRPKFRSRWYLSLFGAIACLLLMFLMNPLYAVLALLFMTVIYFMMVKYNPDKKNLAVIFQGVIFQISRQLKVFLQKAEKEQTTAWRPSAICISDDSFERLDAFKLLKWISHRFGFGTYMHMINGYLSRSAHIEAEESKSRLIKMAEASKSNVYIDTLVSPSYTSAIAQAIQLPGISGKENNLLILEYPRTHDARLKDIVDNFKLIRSIDYDVVLLGSAEKGFGIHKDIHIWITRKDFDNANLMILLSYIIIGHRDWKDATIRIFAIFQEDKMAYEKERLYDLIDAGQLPISKRNIVFIPKKAETEFRTVVQSKSRDADLVIVGFMEEQLRHYGVELFRGYHGVGNILFVNNAVEVGIK
jgi:amino acid transporter